MKFFVIASFVKDKINYQPSGIIKICRGGPAFWIGKTLKNLKIKYQIISSKKPGQVEITVNNKGEFGKIISTEKINFPKKFFSGIFIISTLGDEFELKEIRFMKGIIALDVQGYIRQNKYFSVSPDIANKISILKATKKEAQNIDRKIIEAQKEKRILLITNGSKGFEIFEKGKKYTFKVNKIVGVKNTIGAGDSFLSSFVVCFSEGKTIIESANFAQKYVENFLLKKI